MPAATVSRVVSSIRMNAPVTRLRVYGSAMTGAARSRCTRPMSLSSSSAGGAPSRSVATVEPRVDRLDGRAHAARGVLELVARARAQRRRRSSSRAARRAGGATGGGSSAPQIMLPRPTSMSSREVHDHRHRRERDARPARRASRSRSTVVRSPLGSTTTSSPGAQHAARPSGRRSRGSRSCRGTTHWTGKRSVVEVAVARDLELLEVAQQRRPVVPGRVRERVDDVVAVQRRHRDRQRVLDAELAQHGRRSRARSRGSGPRPSRRGPSCSRTRPCAGSRAAPTGTRGGATARARRCGRRPARRRGRAVEAPVTMLRV